MGITPRFRRGFVAVPAAFLRNYIRLNFSNSEFVFVLRLMSSKWTDDTPYPSYKTLTQRMGITEMAQPYPKSLEAKGLVKRVKRTGQTNAFDLQPLTAALESLLAEKLLDGKVAA